MSEVVPEDEDRGDDGAIGGALGEDERGAGEQVEHGEEQPARED